MPRFNVTMSAVLVFEIDAPNPDAARGAIFHHFEKPRHADPLVGTRFDLDASERECSAPQLMTTTATDTAHAALDVASI